LAVVWFVVLISLMKEVENSSETSVSFCQIILCNSPEHRHLQTLY
jgi:hypothetical protein